MSHKRYAILVAFCAVVIYGIPTLFLYIWSNLVGDVADISVVERQKLSPQSLYLSGIRDDVIDYKLELSKQISPNVVAIGSSRAMQIRAKFFNTNFVNFGGSANSIPELEYVTSMLMKLERKPSIVLIFADVWWFNEKYQNPRLTYTSPHQLDYLTWSNINLLMHPIIESGVVINKPNRLGFGAVYQNQGYDLSGSFHYVSLVNGETPSYDIRFHNILGRIDTGTRKFEYSDSFSNFSVLRFNTIIERLIRSKMRVFIIFPPFASAVYQKMLTSKKYSYMDALTKEISKTHSLFDFTNPKNVQGANDCEFIDGIHGGETIYARMILQLAVVDKYMHDVSNIGYLSDLLKSHSGTSSPETISLYNNGKAEQDFLGLGCAK